MCSGIYMMDVILIFHQNIFRFFESHSKLTTVSLVVP